MARPEKHIPKTLEEAVDELRHGPSRSMRVIVNDVELELRIVGGRERGRLGTRMAALGPLQGESGDEILRILRAARAAGGSAEPPSM